MACSGTALLFTFTAASMKMTAVLDIRPCSLVEVDRRWEVFDGDDHVDGVRLRLWTAATNVAICHLPGDIWAWRTMVEGYRQGKTDSSTRAFWQSYQQNHVTAKQEELMKEMMNLVYEISHISKGSLTSRKISRQVTEGFISSLKEGLLICYGHRPCLNPANLGYNGKHSNH
jgi:hypothetical protein